MRVGFAAGDKKFLGVFHELRNVAAPQVPVPLQHVAVAAYSDEAHVEENRRLYRIKFDLADQILGNRYGYDRPAGGFCVWLRSEEHTSELQSPCNLVCRLLLEKKKIHHYFVCYGGYNNELIFQLFLQSHK